MSLFSDLKELPKLRQDLAEANTKLVEFEAAQVALKEAAAENGKLVIEAANEKKRAEKAESDFAAYQADEGKRNAAYASANIGAHAVKPIKTEPKGTETEKKDLSKLTGLDRAIAANALLHEPKR